MRALTAQSLAASAYRTLGLPASATQQQIDAAARRLRIWPDPNTFPPTPWDSQWLGPVFRSKNDIEQAVAALNDPTSRTQERLLWFHLNDPSIWSAANVLSPNGTLQKLAANRDPASVHDMALVRLQLAMLHDAQFLDAARWKRVFAQLQMLAKSTSFQKWVIELESQGDFEKKAHDDEIIATVQSLATLLADTMAARAEAALEDDDPNTAARILGFLRADDGSSLASSEVEKRILDRLEDLISRRCQHMSDDLERKFLRGGTPLPLAQATCGGCAKFYNDSIDPVLNQLHLLAGANSDRALRGRSSAAHAMEYLGRCWAASSKYPIAEKTLQAALQLAAGTAFEATVHASIERCRENARRSRPPAQPLRPSLGTGTSTVRSSGSGMWRGAGILIGLLLAASRAFMGFNSGSTSSSPSYYNAPSYYNGHVRYSPDGHVITNGDNPDVPVAPPDFPHTYNPPSPPDPPFTGVGPTGMPTFHR